jgi:hypothetical protein
VPDETDLATLDQYRQQPPCATSGHHLWSYINTETRTFGQGRASFKAPVNNFYCQWCLKHTRVSAIFE